MTIKTNIDILVARRRAGLKQWELAQRLGIPQTTLCDLERGRRPITDDFAARIRHALMESGSANQASTNKAN